MLEVSGLNIYYGKAHAVRDVNLQVDESEYVSVIGPNGAGKTTVFNAISGLMPYEGQIRFDGTDLRSLRPHEIVQHGVIHCPEGRSLFPYLSVLDNLRLGAYRRQDSEIEQDLRTVFELFPILGKRQSQTASTLSGGEQQMLAIGRALMSRPRLLMLDEPTLGLAPVVRKHISETLAEIQHRYQATILLAEQNAQFAFAGAQRIYLLETGSIVREGPAEQLRQDEYICKCYLGV